MSVKSDWYDCDWLTGGRRLIVQKFSKHWTLEEFSQDVDNGNALIHSVPYTVDLVLDMSEANTIPDKFFRLGNQALRKRPNNAGILVVATQNMFISRLVTALMKIYSSDSNFRFASDLPSALEVVRAYREEHGYPNDEQA